TETDSNIDLITKIYEFNNNEVATPVATITKSNVKIPAGKSQSIKGSVTTDNPKLWGPPPSQTPHLYKAVTSVMDENDLIDNYETIFCIKDIELDLNQGILVNGELIKIQGVNEHHDLGAIGTAFHLRAAERKLEILREMGVNAIRMAHNPPPPEFLDLRSEERRVGKECRSRGSAEH